MIKAIAHAVFGDYALYKIYRFSSSNVVQDLPKEWDFKPIQDTKAVTDAADQSVSQTVAYAGNDAFGFGLWVEGILASVCWFWAGERYRVQRNFWPLRPGEAKLVQIVTGASFRGRGLAPALLKYAAREMLQQGYTTLYARIWHSNHASIAAFDKAGWRYCAFVAELYPFNGRRSLRFERRVKA